MSKASKADLARVPPRVIALFALPTLAAGYMFCLVNLYIMKFATDILLIAPAAMGTIFAISRVWDAVSDPLVGYLSDKTQTRWGRRRPWLVASALPIAFSFWMVFAPPTALEGALLVLWVGIGIILFYSAQTIFVVPHVSLGAELSDDYHERNKVFGARHAGWIGGYTLALGTMHILIQTEQNNFAALRDVAATQSLLTGFLMIVSLIICAAFIRERADFKGRGPATSLSAMRDMWRNTHARVVLGVIFVEGIGIASITILTLYVAEYVIGNAAMAPIFILSFMVFSFALVPLWMPYARMLGKKRAWMSSLMVSALAYAGMGTLGPGQELELIICAAIAGAGNGCSHTIGPSVKSDIIDYDEYLTGERKEGVYFAGWNFVSKSAFGFVLFITGFALSWAGFVPRAEQSETVIMMFRVLYGGVPFVFFMLGAILLLRFNLNESEHAAIRTQLAAGKRA